MKNLLRRINKINYEELRMILAQYLLIIRLTKEKYLLYTLHCIMTNVVNCT